MFTEFLPPFTTHAVTPAAASSGSGRYREASSRDEERAGPGVGGAAIPAASAGSAFGPMSVFRGSDERFTMRYPVGRVEGENPGEGVAFSREEDGVGLAVSREPLQQSTANAMTLGEYVDAVVAGIETQVGVGLLSREEATVESGADAEKVVLINDEYGLGMTRLMYVHESMIAYSSTVFGPQSIFSEIADLVIICSA